MTGRARRREAAAALQSQGVSGRLTSRLLGMSRRTLKRDAYKRHDDALRAELVTLATSHPRLGYRMLHALIEGSGTTVNHKRVYRIYREEGLMVRRRRRGQWAGVHVGCHAAVGQEERGRSAVHSARQTDAECLCGELQRKVQGRMPERTSVPRHRGSKEDHRKLGNFLQHRPAA